MSTEERPKADLIERVRKILQKTEAANCTQAEAENEFAFASRLMAEHNLSMDEVNASNEVTESWMQEDIHETGRWGLDDNLAYHIVREFFFIEGTFQVYGRRKTLRFFGKASNVEAAKYTWNALHAAIERQWTNYRIINRRPATERRLFVTGLASGFTHKLREERQALEMERDIVKGTASGGTALALISVAKETHMEFKKQNPNLGKPHKANYAAVTGDQGTLAAGYSAGRNLNLSKGVECKAQKGIGN